MVCFAATALTASLIHPQTAGLKLQSLKTISIESLAALPALPMRGHGRGQGMRAARAEHTGHTMLLSAVGPEYSSQLPAGRKSAISDPGSWPQKNRPKDRQIKTAHSVSGAGHYHLAGAILTGARPDNPAGNGFAL